jgi:hypothetical protein
MSDFLFQYYPVHPTTWAYLSSLLMVGLFFKFGRFWSVRNLDLLLLIALAPGLLLIHFGQQQAEKALAALADERSVVEEEALTGGSLISAVQPSAEESPPSEGDLPNADVTPTPASDDGSEDESSIDEQPEIVASPSNDLVSEKADTDDATVTSRGLEYLGFVWLFAASGCLLARLLLDQAMVRRPLLEPNLATGGLTFIGCSLFVFLMANVVSSPISEDDLQGPRGAAQLLDRVADDEGTERLQRHGPGNAVLHLLPSLVTLPQLWSTPAEPREERYVGFVRTAKMMAILSHLAVVVGIVAIGYRHFGNIQTGIGTVTMYLMLPYTSQMTGRVDHVLPAALLIWGILAYRRPLAAGMFIGLAIGVVYYPIFLLPLWISFYWQRGLMRFLSGVFAMLLVMVSSLIFVSTDRQGFLTNIQTMFGIWFPEMEGLSGLWGLGWEPFYRLPVLAAFVAISGAMAIWPVQKNLGTLLSYSAAVMVATQFWHGYGGGLYVAWYLPLLLLTIFRPNLEDRVALTVLGEGWFPRRRPPTTVKRGEKAA